MNRGDFRNENKFERARERYALLPACPFASRRNNFSGDSRPFEPTIKQTIDLRPNYKLVLPFSHTRTHTRSLSLSRLSSLHERGEIVPPSISISSHSIPTDSFFLLARGGEEEKEWTERFSKGEGGRETFDAFGRSFD